GKISALNRLNLLLLFASIELLVGLYGVVSLDIFRWTGMHALALPTAVTARDAERCPARSHNQCRHCICSRMLCVPPRRRWAAYYLRAADDEISGIARSVFLDAVMHRANYRIYIAIL